MKRSDASRGGFTLIEVTVVLALSGIVLLGARAMLVQLADDGDRIVRAAAEADRDANADRLLRTLAGRVEAASDSTPGLIGVDRVARFRTWCDVPAGWQEPCEVTLAITRLENEEALVLRGSDERIIPLRRGFRSGRLLYLHDAGGGGVWLRSWESTITTPLALGVVLDADTLIVRMGERG